MYRLELCIKAQIQSYPIYIGSGILEKAGELIAQHLPYINRRIIIITTRDLKHHLPKLLAALEKASYVGHVIELPEGESAKDLSCIASIYEELSKLAIDRSSCIVAFGGGSVGDSSGFVAATYLRGLSFVQIPTTLLSQVDSSIGGKVGINLVKAKNLVGAFYQPRMVISDINLIKSLPEVEFRQGMAEIIKYAMIESKDLFFYLHKYKEDIKAYKEDALFHIICSSCRIKSKIVEEDEREHNLRMVLNFGHTLGHALEAASDYKLKHGDCIAVGMCFDTALAQELKIAKGNILNELESLLRSYDLSTALYADKSRVLTSLWLDKKRQGKELRFILPEEIGKVKIVEIADLSMIERLLPLFIDGA